MAVPWLIYHFAGEVGTAPFLEVKMKKKQKPVRYWDEWAKKLRAIVDAMESLVWQEKWKVASRGIIAPEPCPYRQRHRKLTDKESKVKRKKQDPRAIIAPHLWE